MRRENEKTQQPEEDKRIQREKEKRQQQDWGEHGDIWEGEWKTLERLKEYRSREWENSDRIRKFRANKRIQRERNISQ